MSLLKVFDKVIPVARNRRPAFLIAILAIVMDTQRKPLPLCRCSSFMPAIYKSLGTPVEFLLELGQPRFDCLLDENEHVLSAKGLFRTRIQLLKLILCGCVNAIVPEVVLVRLLR